MKKITLFMFFVCVCMKTFSQNAYYEALYYDAISLDDIKHNIIQSENMKEKTLYSKMTNATEKVNFDKIENGIKKEIKDIEKETIDKIKPVLNEMAKKADFINTLFTGGATSKSITDFNNLLDKSILKDKDKIKANAKLKSPNVNITKNDAQSIIDASQDIDINKITITDIEDFIKQNIDNDSKSKINQELSNNNDLIINKANEYFKDKGNFFVYLKQIIIIQGHQTKFSDQDYAVLKALKNFKEDPFNHTKPDLSKLKTAFEKFNYSISAKSAESATLFSLTNLLNPLGFLSALPQAQADTLLRGLAIYINEQVNRTHTETVLGIIERRFGRYHDFKLLFPKTYEKMISHDWTKMQDLGNEFKQVFKEDYKNFTANFFTLIENPKKEDWSGKQFMVFDADLRAKIYQKPYYAWSKVYLDAGKQMIDGLHPVKVLQHIDEKYKNYADSMYYQNNILDNKINTLESKNKELEIEKSTATTERKEKIDKEIKNNKIEIEKISPLKGLINFVDMSNNDTLIFNQDILFKLKEEYTINGSKVNKMIIKPNTNQPEWINTVFSNTKNIEVTFKDGATPKTVNFTILTKKACKIKYLQETKIALTKGEVVKKLKDEKLEEEKEIQFKNNDNNLEVYEIITKDLAANTSLSLKDIFQIEVPKGIEFSIDFGKESYNLIFTNSGNDDKVDYYASSAETTQYLKIGERNYKLKTNNPTDFIKTENQNPSLIADKISQFVYKPKINENEIDPLDIKLEKGKPYLFPKNLKFVITDKQYRNNLLKDLNEKTTFQVQYEHKEEYKNLYDFFHTLNFIQENIRDTSSKVVDRFSKVWLNFDQLKKLEQNYQKRLYFLGVLKSNDSTAFKNLCTYAKIDTKALFTLKESDLTDGNKRLILDKDYDTFKAKYVSPLLSVLTKSEDYLKMKEGTLYEGDNFLNYVKFFGDFIMSFDYKKEGVVDQDIHELFDNASGVINSVKTQNFNNFLFDFMGILKYSFKKDSENIDKSNGDSKEIWKGYKFFNMMDEFGGFTSNIINSKTSEDVNSALKKYVRQNNSFTTSRTRRFTISLTSHPGIVWGRETDKDSITNKFLEKKANVTGLSMPVGMKFTFRPDCIFKNTGFGRMFGSFTLMFNPIDLGSLVNYRWKSQLTSPLSADSTSKAKASDIFTRHFNNGITVGISLKNLPINIEYVYQTSNARQGFTYKDNGKDITVLNTRQNLIRVSYDINLLNIFKTRK